MFPLKITTSYLSFYCCWFIEPFLKIKCKEFSRIVCVSLFSYQGSLFLSRWQLVYFITSVFVCQELFSSFLKIKCKEFSRIVCVSLFSYQGSLFLSRWQLVYFITSVFVCQELFSSFFKLFLMLFFVNLCLADSLFTLPHFQVVVNNFFEFFKNFLLYHICFRLSRTFFKFFQTFFDVVFCKSLSRWQLVYFTTLSSGCQQLFWIF